jgi:hypothetical protein
MLQLILIALGVLVSAMGAMVLAKRELKVSAARTLEGSTAAAAGGVVIAIGLATVLYAWLILPR